MKYFLKKLFLELLKFYVVLIAVCVGWTVLEKLTMGEVITRKVDNIIAIIFATSLYFNFKNYWSLRSESEVN